MKDGFGRNIDYLRISVTDKCNLDCCYCKPLGKRCETYEGMKCLKPDEFVEVAKAAAALGISKVRITGGEPLLYEKLADIIKRIKLIPEISQVGITTNGVLLKEKLAVLQDAGVDVINVSLDTLNGENYKKITGSDKLNAVLEGIEDCLNAGIKLRINTVLMQNINEAEWKDIVFMAAEKPIDVRFIELMPVGYGRFLKGVSNTELIKKLGDCFGDIKKSSYKGNGPAVYYEIPGFKGYVGFINPIHGKFCGECNRLRLTADGKIKPCLCYEDAVDLTVAVHDSDRLEKFLLEAVGLKPEGHCFGENEELVEHKSMSSIGG